jgi:hypothetical protein
MGLITTTDHIRNIINGIDCNITVSSVEASGGNWKLITTNTKWATYGKLLSDKKIVDFVLNQYIIIQSTTEPIPGTFTLPTPYFFSGTFLETNIELTKTKSSNQKLPMIYLHMNAPENYYDQESTIDFESDCAIYFMVDCNPKDWLRADHLENAIKPMKQLARGFYRSLLNYSKTNAANTITFIENDYARFGKVSWEGINRAIFNDNMSGTEMLIKIPFNKCFNCCLN